MNLTPKAREYPSSCTAIIDLVKLKRQFSLMCPGTVSGCALVSLWLAVLQGDSIEKSRLIINRLYWGVVPEAGEGLAGKVPYSPGAMASSRRFMDCMKALDSAPSLMRWSKDIHRFIIDRMAMASLMTTGRFCTASVVIMAAWG